MTEDQRIEDGEFNARVPTTAGQPPVPFPTIGLAMKVAELCDGYRLLPTGAPLLVVRYVRRSTAPGPHGGVRSLVPRAATVLAMAVKPDDAEAFGDGGISFPVARYAENGQGRIDIVDGPIAIGMGEIMETTEAIFGEKGIADWMHKNHGEPPIVSWLEPEQTAAVRLCRVATMVGHVFTDPDIVAVKERVGEMIGLRIRSLSDVTRIRPSRPETTAWARGIVADLHRLGYDDQFISKGLTAIREREVEEFMQLVNAPQR